MARPRGFHHPGDPSSLDPISSDRELNVMHIDKRSSETTYRYGRTTLSSERKAKGELLVVTLVRVAHLQNFPTYSIRSRADNCVCGESFPRYNPVQYAHVRIPSYAKINWDTTGYGRVGCGPMGQSFLIVLIFPKSCRHVVMCKVSLKMMKHQQYLVNNSVLECHHLYDNTHRELVKGLARTKKMWQLEVLQTDL